MGARLEDIDRGRSKAESETGKAKVESVQNVLRGWERVRLFTLVPK